MRLIDSIANGLTGALDMARNQSGWEQRMDMSPEAVFRSFWAVPLALPGLVLATISAQRLAVAEGGPAAPLWYLLVDRGLTALVVWGLVVFFYVQVAKRLEAGWRISPLLIVNNYTTFLGYILFGLGMGAASVAGNFDLIWIVWPAVMMLGLWLDWGMLRRGLGLPPDAAVVTIAFIQIAALLIAALLSMIVIAVFSAFGFSYQQVV